MLCREWKSQNLRRSWLASVKNMEKRSTAMSRSGAACLTMKWLTEQTSLLSMRCASLRRTSLAFLLKSARRKSNPLLRNARTKSLSLSLSATSALKKRTISSVARKPRLSVSHSPGPRREEEASTALNAKNTVTRPPTLLSEH